MNELAAKIIDGLDKLASKHASASKRWVWELIQNAQDSKAEGRVKVEITVDEKSVNRPLDYR